jgi:hypothetical protein
VELHALAKKEKMEPAQTNTPQEEEILEEVLVVLEFEHEKNHPLQIKPGQKISILVVNSSIY